MEKLGSSLKWERESKAAEFHGAFHKMKERVKAGVTILTITLQRHYFTKQGIFWSLGRNGVCCLVRTTAS